MALTSDDQKILKFYIEDMIQKVNPQAITDFISLDDAAKVVALKAWGTEQYSSISARLQKASTSRNKYQNQIDFLDNYLP